MKIDDNGCHYYEFTPERNGDIIDEIKYETSTDLDAKLTYSIDYIDYLPEKFNEFLFFSAPFIIHMSIYFLLLFSLLIYYFIFRNYNKYKIIKCHTNLTIFYIFIFLNNF